MNGPRIPPPPGHGHPLPQYEPPAPPAIEKARATLDRVRRMTPSTATQVFATRAVGDALVAIYDLLDERLPKPERGKALPED